MLVTIYFTGFFILLALGLGTFLRPDKPWKPIAYKYGIAAICWPVTVLAVVYFCAKEFNQYKYRINIDGDHPR